MYYVMVEKFCDYHKIALDQLNFVYRITLVYVHT